MLSCVPKPEYIEEENNKELPFKYEFPKINIIKPKSSYIIKSEIKKNLIYYSKVDFEIISFESSSIILPSWIDISLYLIKTSKTKIIYILLIKNNTIENLDKIKNKVRNKKERSEEKEEEKNNQSEYNKIENKGKKLILYSHGNGTDLFGELPFMIDLCSQLQCDILTYDYSGFGCSSGKPQIRNLFIDIEIVIKFVSFYLLYQMNNVSLLAKDIGCIPSIQIASLLKYSICQSLILISPFLSGGIIKKDTLKKINCPTLLINEINPNSYYYTTHSIIRYCQEIPTIKNWLPKKKEDKNIFNNNDSLYTYRKKFLMLMKKYIFNEKEEIQKLSYIKNSGNGRDFVIKNESMGEKSNSESEHPSKRNELDDDIEIYEKNEVHKFFEEYDLESENNITDIDY